jgi:hypothetical protein
VRSKLAELLHQADQADPAAADMLFAMLYDELHRLAEHHLQRSGSSLTLSATTLVHEAYLNIVGRQAMVFPDRARFFAHARHSGRVAGERMASHVGATTRVSGFAAGFRFNRCSWQHILVRLT